MFECEHSDISLLLFKIHLEREQVKKLARHNFFQRLERELDVQFEYEKIENIVLNERNMGMILNEEI